MGEWVGGCVDGGWVDAEVEWLMEGWEDKWMGSVGGQR